MNDTTSQPPVATMTSLPPPARFTPEMITRGLMGTYDQMDMLFTVTKRKDGQYYILSSETTTTDDGVLLLIATRRAVAEKVYIPKLPPEPKAAEAAPVEASKDEDVGFHGFL